ncbi:hypothetical protein HanXRQr2_Chr01g0022751 [Helianthus annuus]|uniref:Uncharacterized protein n=1 Tax=Helianthus annuus TaxID=4232 RepID=A0A9K3JX30_HELAN|nr:hypothetical protein HanXRQr2_Chr01g0022751 [Helianthus annuus]
MYIVKIKILVRVNCSDGPCGFTFSLHLLKIAGMLPMVCHFVTRIVPRVNVRGLSE